MFIPIVCSLFVLDDTKIFIKFFPNHFLWDVPCIGVLNWNVLNPSTYVSDTHYIKEFSFITEYRSVLASSSHMQSSWYGYFRGALNCFHSFAFFLFCLRIYSMVTNLGTGCQESWVLPSTDAQSDGTCIILLNWRGSKLSTYVSELLSQRNSIFVTEHCSVIASQHLWSSCYFFDLSLIPHPCLCKWVMERSPHTSTFYYIS